MVVSIVSIKDLLIVEIQTCEQISLLLPFTQHVLLQVQSQAAHFVRLVFFGFLDLLHILATANVLENFRSVYLIDFAQELNLAFDFAELVQRQVVVILLGH